MSNKKQKPRPSPLSHSWSSLISATELDHNLRALSNHGSLMELANEIEGMAEETLSQLSSSADVTTIYRCQGALEILTRIGGAADRMVDELEEDKAGLPK